MPTILVGRRRWAALAFFTSNGQIYYFRNPKYMLRKRDSVNTSSFTWEIVTKGAYVFLFLRISGLEDTIYNDPKDIDRWFRPIGGQTAGDSSLSFEAASFQHSSIRFRPLNGLYNETYSVYWKIAIL